MPKEYTRKMSWGDFLVQLKREYCSKRNIFEVIKDFQDLRNGKMSVRKYFATFTEKTKLIPYLVLIELSKIKKNC